ncbi:MAG: hypothetical protein HY744_21015 [Deltaproteobacteria bacterium]|nr:hypothetical protein [Deltaproteobacteria bacterium]
MFVWGGRPQAEGSPDPLATGGLYDPEANAWETTSEDGAPVPRFQHHCLWTGTHVIVIGGANVEHATTGGLYDPESAAWTSMSAEGLPVDDAPAPYMRDFFVPFHLGWDGCRVVMWGAYASEWQAWAYYPPPEIRAAAIPEQAAKPQP